MKSLRPHSSVTDSIDDVVSTTHAIMRESSRMVLDGFELDSDANIVPYPDCDMEEDRGQVMWNPKTALPDLIGVPADRIDDNRLYRSLDKLLPHKETLEVHLKRRMGELFGLEYDLLLYDVTSTYFEGQCKSNPLAQRGYSRDQRSDCKQVCIALVVSRCGMPVR